MQRFLAKRKIEDEKHSTLMNKKSEDIKKKTLNTSRRKKVAVRKNNRENEHTKEDKKDLKNKDPNIKELPEIVKPLVKEESVEYVVVGDGPCLIRTASAHITG